MEKSVDTKLPEGTQVFNKRHKRELCAGGDGIDRKGSLWQQRSVKKIIRKKKRSNRTDIEIVFRGCPQRPFFICVAAHYSPFAGRITFFFLTIKKRGGSKKKRRRRGDTVAQYTFITPRPCLLLCGALKRNRKIRKKVPRLFFILLILLLLLLFLTNSERRRLPQTSKSRNESAAMTAIQQNESSTKKC